MEWIKYWAGFIHFILLFCLWCACVFKNTNNNGNTQYIELVARLTGAKNREIESIKYLNRLLVYTVYNVFMDYHTKLSIFSILTNVFILLRFGYQVHGCFVVCCLRSHNLRTR